MNHSSVRPQVRPAHVWTLQSPTEIRLDNGARLWLYQLPGQYVISAQVVMDAPLSCEPAAVEGCATIAVRSSDEGSMLHPGSRLAEAVEDIGAIYVGSESHPYAVKPTGTVVAEAIGAGPNLTVADYEFACKAGSEAMVAAIGFVGSGMAEYALAIGMDSSQGKPGDALEYSTGAGGSAYLFGPAEQSLAVIEGTYSYVTDTPDFWRREYQKYPEHGQRFTGEPAYFKHVTSAASRLMASNGTTPADYRYVIFHQPNTKFPQRAAKLLGFSKEQILPGLLTPVIGNTYAGSSLVGMTAVLDIAEPGDRILMVSFGSGAGSDAIALRATEALVERRDRALKTLDYIARRTEIDYGTYVRYKGKITLR